MIEKVYQNHVKLMLAIERNDLKTVQEILTKIDSNELSQPAGPLRVTVLQLAVWYGSIDLLDRLHEKGIDINATDKIGRCALYYAVQRGNVEMTKWLLERGCFVENKVGINSCERDKPSFFTSDCLVGKDLPLPDCWGRTPLHQAVKNNHYEVVQILLKYRADVNLKDDRGIAPILLAGSCVDSTSRDEMSKFEEIIDVLISAKAHVNVIHPDTGSTVLHHATTLASSKATNVLLKGGACPLLQCSSTGSTPLHIAAGLGNMETLLILLAATPSNYVDIRDKVNRTSLHRAAYQSHCDCLRVLINYGANLAAKTKTGITVIDAIFAYVPGPLSFFMSILDSRVHCVNSASLHTNVVAVDFTVLAPKGELQMDVVTAIIEAASDTEHLTILQHPLVETFLCLKWSRLRIFFFLLVFVHIIFVLSLSTYAVTLLHHIMDYNISGRILVLSSCIILFHNVVQVFMMPRHYLKQFETWLSVTTASISLVTSLTGEYTEGIRDGTLEHPPQWVLHAASIAILLGWIQMMLLVGRFPTWGYYALMFSTVLKNVLKVLLAFICLIIGFAFSFAVLFDGNDQFRNSWRAVVKTIVMMMGEYEYDELFGTEGNDTYLPVTSRIVFLAFVMLASIVLMNLMIGLAVNDIQALEKEGHIRRLVKQAEFVAHLERVISHRIFRGNWLHPRLRMFLDTRRGIPTKMTLTCRKNYLRESSHGVPTELIEALCLLASKNSFNGERKKIHEMTLEGALINIERQLQELRQIYYPSLSENRLSKLFRNSKMSLTKKHSIIT